MQCRHANMVKGARVVRGVDWKYGDVDKSGEGTITKEVSLEGYIIVNFPGSLYRYRMGFDGKFDTKLI